MAVELRNWLESRIEINLPISELMRGASLDQLTVTVCQAIGDAASGVNDYAPTAGDEPITGDKVISLLEQVPDMADDEVDRLLDQMLRQQSDG